MLVLRRLVAGVREHALVLRRAHALRAAQDEGWWAAVLRSGFRFRNGFVDDRGYTASQLNWIHTGWAFDVVAVREIK